MKVSRTTTTTTTTKALALAPPPSPPAPLFAPPIMTAVGAATSALAAAAAAAAEDTAANTSEKERHEGLGVSLSGFFFPSSSFSPSPPPPPQPKLLLKQQQQSPQQGPAILDWARDLVGTSSSSSEEEDEDDDSCITDGSSFYDSDDFADQDDYSNDDHDHKDDNNKHEEKQEDPHETAAVKALVRAAFDGTLAQPVLQRLLGSSRRRNSSSSLPGSSSPNKKRDLEASATAQDSPSSKRARRPDSTRASSNNSNRLLTAQELHAMRSQSAPALVHLAGDEDNHHHHHHDNNTNSTCPPKPDEVLQSLLESAGYTYQTVPALHLRDTTTFFEPVTPESIAAYDMELLQAIRNENIAFLQEQLAAGKNLQCSNRFGESVVHTACRRGSCRVLHFLLHTAAVSCRVVCDSGRTALADACWTAKPNFAVVDLILDACPDLLYVTDKRGCTPLEYIRPQHQAAWCDYLRRKAATATVENGGARHPLAPRELFQTNNSNNNASSSSSSSKTA